MLNPDSTLIDAIYQKLAECEAENKPRLLHIEFTADHTIPHQLQCSLENACLINGDDYALAVAVDEIAPGPLPELTSPSSPYIIDNAELIEESSLINGLSQILQAGGVAIVFGLLEQSTIEQLANVISAITTT